MLKQSAGILKSPLQQPTPVNTFHVYITCSSIDVYTCTCSPGKADAGGVVLCVSEAPKFMGMENVHVLDKDSVLEVAGRSVLVWGGTGFAMTFWPLVLRSLFRNSL